jgi:hypothetical protein
VVHGFAIMAAKLRHQVHQLDGCVFPPVDLGGMVAGSDAK